jgi:hypothetical protein
MIRAGWRQVSETEFEIQLDDWRAAREPLAAAMGTAIAPWMPYFGSHDLTSRQAFESVHDEAILREGRARFAAWLRAEHPDWITPSRACAPR